MQEIEIVNVRLTVAGDEIGFMNEIRHTNRVFAEPEMRYGYAARFLRIISKITLRIQIRIVADNLNCRLIGADRSVGAKAPEFAGMKSFLSQAEVTGPFEGQVRYVVDNSYDEMVLWSFLFQVVKAGNDVGR